MTWLDLLKRPRYRWAMLACLAVLMAMVFYVPTYFATIIQPKAAVWTTVYDPLMNMLSPREWSVPIFGIIWLSALQTIISLSKRPALFATTLIAYCAVTMLRMACIFLFTLNPPVDMILLVDPLTSFLVYPDNTFARDLFFSGHVSTMWILTLGEPSPTLKRLKIIGTALLGFMLIWQHVHYTIDVVAAPILTWAVFRIAKWLYPIPPPTA